jgi:hypothetical protein
MKRVSTCETRFFRLPKHIQESAYAINWSQVRTTELEVSP